MAIPLVSVFERVDCEASWGTSRSCSNKERPTASLCSTVNQFRERSAVTRVTASVLTYTNKHGGEKAVVHRRFLKICLLKFCDIWQNFYFYRILINANFKMDVEQTIFVTHLIIKV